MDSVGRFLYGRFGGRVPGLLNKVRQVLMGGVDDIPQAIAPQLETLRRASRIGQNPRAYTPPVPRSGAAVPAVGGGRLSGINPGGASTARRSAPAPEFVGREGAPGSLVRNSVAENLPEVPGMRSQLSPRSAVPPTPADPLAARVEMMRRRAGLGPTPARPVSGSRPVVEGMDDATRARLATRSEYAPQQGLDLRNPAGTEAAREFVTGRGAVRPAGTRIGGQRFVDGRTTPPGREVSMARSIADDVPATSIRTPAGQREMISPTGVVMPIARGGMNTSRMMLDLNNPAVRAALGGVGGISTAAGVITAGDVLRQDGQLPVTGSEDQTPVGAMPRINEAGTEFMEADLTRNALATIDSFTGGGDINVQRGASMEERGIIENPPFLI